MASSQRGLPVFFEASLRDFLMPTPELSSVLKDRQTNAKDSVRIRRPNKENGRKPFN